MPTGEKFDRRKPESTKWVRYSEIPQLSRKEGEITSRTPEILLRRAINQHRNPSIIQNSTNPTNKTLRKLKAPENLKQKKPTNEVERLSDINLQDKLNPTAVNA